MYPWPIRLGMAIVAGLLAFVVGGACLILLSALMTWLTTYGGHAAPEVIQREQLRWQTVAGGLALPLSLVVAVLVYRRARPRS